jgi:hypothetical protein
MPLLALIVLWVVLSLVTAPIVGALFVPRHRNEDRRHREDAQRRVKETRSRAKESAGPCDEAREV